MKTYFFTVCIALWIAVTSSVQAVPLSDADDPQHEEYLTEHYISLIDLCHIAKKYLDDQESPLAPFILNPDFMGAMQLGDPSLSIDINQCLLNAVRYFHFSLTPPEFENTTEGYIQSVDWIMRQFGQNLPYAWAKDLWAEGSFFN